VALHERIRSRERSAPPPADGVERTAAAPPAVRRAPRLPVVAVMPFEVLPPAEPALAATLSQELVGGLARIAGYSVADGRMLFGGAEFASDRGRAVVVEHRVAFVVTGRLERTGGVAHRLSVRLLDGDDGRHRWSRRVDLDDDSAKARDALIAATVARIEPQIVLGRAGQPADDEPTDAEDPWPRVREAFAALFAHGWSEHSVETAVAKYRAAVTVAPELALAHAHMSLVLALGAKMGLVAGAAPLEEARRAADRAIALAPTDSEVLGCAGCAIADLGDPALGETLLERAVEENPDNPQAWAALGACRLSLARVEAGLEALERGVRVGSSDYRRTVWFTLMSRALLQKRRFDDAIEAARSAVRSDVFFYPAWLALAAAQFRAGRHPQATHAIAQALRIRPQLRVEEVHPWVGPRTTSRLREVWPAAYDDDGGRSLAADAPSPPLTPH
jgi:TolB-like protein/Tfp pilus assembly protein PilF